MTDQNPSGASFAPAADTQATAASAETHAGNFGITRGSGLARGKRQSSAAAPTTSTATSDYKPVALEVITPASEYKNPFASAEPVSAPAAEPAKVEMFAAPAAAVETEPVAVREDPVVPAPEAEKRELQILPPAEANRPSISWESQSTSHENPAPSEVDRPQRDERPTFRPDRREDAAAGQAAESTAPRSDGRAPRNDSFRRQPRDPREARQPRDPREARQPRDPRDERQPRDPRFERQPRDPRDERPRYDQRPQGAQAEQTAPSSKGFFGWLKSLFGASKPAEAPAAREHAGERPSEGQRPRRRHRGGRGGNPQGFRGDRSFQGGPRRDGPRPDGQPAGEGENRGGERHGGPRRRRHRGGPGRDRGGEPRAEGHQGGGAI